MAVKKIKISATKRANHLKGKKKVFKTQKPPSENLLKKGQFQSTAPRRSKKKDKPKKTSVAEPLLEPENDEKLLENLRDIVDEDAEYLNFTDIAAKKSRKRKHNDSNEPIKSDLEREYTSQQRTENKSKKMVLDLLPIKSKQGEIITRTTEVDFKPKLTQNDAELDGNEEDDEDDENAEVMDSDEDILEDVSGRNGVTEENAPNRIISAADLLIQREQELERQKYRIGIICSGILEKPEDKMKNFGALFDLMEDYNRSGSRNLFSVRKLAIVSIAEVFKDILPEYRVGQVDTKMTTVRKATLERVTYETALLQQFKKFLQRAEKLVSCITKKGGPQKTQENIKLAEVMVESLCEVLLAHPYFNYVKNVTQMLVYLLNCRYPTIREKINACFKELFKTDQKLEMSLFAIRRINYLIKKKSNNVHLEMISCLLALHIKDVNLDAEKEFELKQKKLEAHRQRLLSMSKKEKKRMKKLRDVTREMEETKAEENKQTKLQKLTEITKMIFTIYFRILKNDPNSKLLSGVLEGLAQFAHVINIDFFSDLVEILNRLLESGELGYREQLHCIHTIFMILSGQGEVLNIDPIRFYGHFYNNLLAVTAGKNHEDFSTILRALQQVLIKRKKNISMHRLCAFLKRLTTMSLHLLHNGTMASLCVVKILLQMSSNLDVILDTDTIHGSGRYDPELNDPEFCNSTCTALYELALLNKHYHPTTRTIAKHVALGAPAIGDGNLPTDLRKLGPEDMFNQFDSSQVAFNPPIPPPAPAEPKIKKGRHIYVDTTLEGYCAEVLSSKVENGGIIDFRPVFHAVFAKKTNKTKINKVKK